MEQNLDNKIKELEAKIDLIYTSVEKTRKYILWTGIVTLALIILPIIGILFTLPSLLDTYSTSLNMLEGL